jgi:hypothetical protein
MSSRPGLCQFNEEVSATLICCLVRQEAPKRLTITQCPHMRWETSNAAELSGCWCAGLLDCMLLKVRTKKGRGVEEVD